MTYYLAIDQGTHASRACLFDQEGTLVSEQTKKIQLKTISNTHIEQDADEIVDSVKEVVARVLQGINTHQAIVACGITSQRSSVVSWLADGTAVSAVLSWQDTRGARRLENLRSTESEIQLLSGLPLSAHYGASKLKFLHNAARHKNISLDRLRLSPLISYLLFHILEEHPYIVDHTNAQRTQLFSITDMNWSPRLADLFEVPLRLLPDCVPVVNHSNKAHGKLVGTDIPVTAISGDQNAAMFGAGRLTAETALINFGSGAFILRSLSHYQASKKQLSSIACSENNTVQYVREATINGAGSALTWLEKKHQVNDLWQQLPAWLSQADPGQNSQPPVFINSIGGLGSPWWNNKIEPIFLVAEKTLIKAEADLAAFELTTSDQPAQAVAVIESIVFMVCSNLEIMQSEQRLTRLRVCGGLSQLDGLCQRLANLSALPVERMVLPEATAKGIAWLAADKPEHWSHVNLETFEPVSNAALSERYALFKAVLSRLLK